MPANPAPLDPLPAKPAPLDSLPKIVPRGPQQHAERMATAIQLAKEQREARQQRAVLISAAQREDAARVKRLQAQAQATSSPPAPKPPPLRRVRIVPPPVAAPTAPAPAPAPRAPDPRVAVAREQLAELQTHASRLAQDGEARRRDARRRREVQVKA